MQSTEEILTGDNGDGENSNPDGNEDKSEQPLREQDRFLPIANIAKIMKKAIPETGKVILEFNIFNGFQLKNLILRKKSSRFNNSCSFRDE